MVRHGRIRTLANKCVIENFDSELNRHIKRLEDTVPDSWAFVLNYIDCEASLPTRYLNSAHTSEQQVKEIYRCYGKAQIFYRLARLKESGED